MVSALGTHLKLSSTQLALKVIAQHEAQIDIGLEHPSSAKSPEKILLDATVTAKARVEIRANSTRSDGDIAGGVFMTSLKTWIVETSCDAASAAQGKAMSAALTSGTLKVCDPVEGIVVTAWDVEGQRPVHVKRSQITPAGWSLFLKQHVKREDGVGYVKDADGGYVDVMSGESAYFGAVGSKFYYLTWPRHSSNI